MGDRRLKASHWRVLSAIAWHDRFGVNGVGCTAGGRTLAREANVHATNLPKITRDLQDWGYIDKKHRASNRRLRTYQVIYREYLEAVGGGTIDRDASAPEDRSQTATIGVQTNNGGEIVGVANSQVAESEDKQASEYIPLRGIDNRIGKKGDASLKSVLGTLDQVVKHNDADGLNTEHPSSVDGQDRSHHQLRPFERSLGQIEECHRMQSAHQRIVKGLGSDLYEIAVELDQKIWLEAERSEADDPGVGAAMILDALSEVHGKEIKASK